MTDNLDDYRWLTGPQAEVWLTRMSTARDLLAAAGQLRKELSPQRTHLILEQVELRRRGAKKFTHAASMFFTPRALEQATDELVARHKAARFPPFQPAVDLCCGIGGDLLALAAGRPATGVDRDPVATLFAAANCRAQPGAPEGSSLEAHLLTADVDEAQVADCAAWHIDPDRRVSGRRITKVELAEPGPEVIGRLLARQPSASIKLAPAAEFPEDWSQAAELEWISSHGECRQLVAWFGILTSSPGQRRATVLKNALPARSIVGQIPPGPLRVEPPIAANIGRYVFEPDAAVLAAGLTAALAAEHRLAALAGGIAYLTGDEAIDDLALAAFEVQEVLPYDARRVKTLLRERGIGTLEVKKRGVQLEPEAVRRQVAVPGEHRGTLLLTKIAGSVTAILATRQ